ncbi:methylamine utilization protein MauF (plasmid) [Paracoccus versutus]|uniref:Methylamine utilization protein MauF n=2 Tax=Paracoccus versutus TaxID=34007 RepID=MAUF_PARVE|nr:methylamine utilization protein MauF [Paracoccus versutus]Q56463.1 RecName: Full=Methylamine utilization protein MauF [Paracoccus versutus]AAA85386.1 membrane protein [Paracoccus versutus]KGJ12062.1 methylamine utilization protein MauF [Paracoccus versutus]REG33751.1 cytochrome c biogenesis protein CcdA [Paracoccus versutus]WEJ80479.1 methylamine utilization protein MauF [Paracoccus versutus]
MASLDNFDMAAGRTDGVADCVAFPGRFSTWTRALILAASAAGGGAAALAMDAAHVALVLGLAAFAGGLLSTWSPCGYSSISLLRPTGKGARAVLDWLPTFATHGLGYALGALILGTLLGAIGGIAGLSGFATSFGLGLLAVIGLAYGAHQLDFLRVPYPQRRAQVPHDARQRFPKWVVGGLYGLSLGLDYLTYVQTPLLYLVTAAAVLSGNVAEAVALIAIFNLGRYLPVAVNLLPVTDYQIQSWLGRNQERAAIADGAILTAVGAAFAMLALA